MIPTRWAHCLVVGLGVSACTAFGPPAGSTGNRAIDPAIAPVVDRVLRSDIAMLTIRRDGRLTGKVGPDQNLDLEGTWAIRDGRFCRTLTAPPELLDRVSATACQDFRIDGDTFTIIGPDGATAVYAVE